MDNATIISNLNALIHLDIDAVFAYGEAIDKVEEQQIRDELMHFQGDHERHITALSAKVRGLGGQPPDRSPDLKGYLIEGVTALRSLTGTKGALNAMEMNEKITNKTYAKYAGMDHPAEIQQLIADFYCDEKRHLAYIQQMLHLLQAKHPAEQAAAQSAEIQVYHVVAHGAAGWWIELDEGVVEKLDSKPAAVRRAQELAKSCSLCQVVVHDLDGAVETQQTFREGSLSDRR